MITHDPRKTAEDLRNHLASPDCPLAFLLGAGTSSAVNVAPAALPGKRRGYEPLVPPIDALTKRCEAAVKGLKKGFPNAWQLIWTECEGDTGSPNIEQILTKVQSKLDAVGDSEKLVGLSAAELRSLEECIRKTIAGAVVLQEEDIPLDLPHDLLARWLKHAGRMKPVELFTTNYDILIERALEHASLPVFDGFIGSYEPFFDPDSLEHGAKLLPRAWTRLWKIHGSVNWQLVSRHEKRRIIRTRPTPSGEMIFPSHRKYDESRKQPYTALMDRLAQFLKQEHSFLVTSGYSFGDQHINAVIFGALENHPSSNVIALHFSALTDSTPLVKQARITPNLTVIGPNGAVISTRWGTWRLIQAVDNASAPFMDIAFDSNAVVDSDEEPDSGDADPLLGKMRLGDFNALCAFLNTMDRSSEGAL